MNDSKLLSLGLLFTFSFASISTFAIEPTDHVNQEQDQNQNQDQNVDLSVLQFDLKNIKGEKLHLSIDSSTKVSDRWATKDPQVDKVEGTSTDRAYKEFKRHIDKHVKPVIVAVIDSGVDIKHKEFKGKIWVNEAELNGKQGVDDDGDGYVDDINGWNFLGNKNGANVVSTTLEVTREYKRLADKSSQGGLSTEEEKYFERVKKLYVTKSVEASQILTRVKAMAADYAAALEILKKEGLKKETVKAVNKIAPKDQQTLDAKNKVLAYLQQGRNTEAFNTRITFWTGQVKTSEQYYFNLNLNSSDVIGDHPTTMDEKGYGNSDVLGGDGEHGSHVSGIIAARRHNWAGIEGQADNVLIMSLRAVPDGDERDKDIANAVNFAVNHGAKIINMSFGKPLSPNRDYVMAAFKFAEENDVLIVHAAGNDNMDLDLEESYNYPSRKMLNSDQSVSEISTWIEVGASGALMGKALPADFSNYGKKSVDFFAPGVGIKSTIPGGKYAAFSGTSMASPEVAGVAALIWSQFPHLKAAQVRELLMKTSRSYEGLLVTKPGETEKDKPVLFSDLSIMGGIVSAFNAMKALITL